MLSRDPVADRIGAVVVAACTRTARGLLSELPLTTDDGMRSDCVVTFDNLHTLRRGAFSRRQTRLSTAKMDEACRVIARSLGCV